MTEQDIHDGLADDEEIEATFPLRNGGEVGLAQGRMVVSQSGEVTTVDAEAITEIVRETYDWFLVVMSFVLVGFGAYTLERNALGGLAFAAAGVANLYLTYRKRNPVRVHVKGRRRPITVRAEEPERLYAAMETALSE